MIKSVNNFLVDAAVRHAHFLEAFKNGEARAIVKLLEQDVFPDLLDRLQSGLERIGGRGVGYSLRSTKRGMELAASTAGLLLEGVRKINKDRATPMMQELGVTEAEWQVKTLKQATNPFRIEFDRPNLPKLRSIVTSKPMEGKIMKDWYDDLGASTQKNVVREINAGLGAGEEVDTIVRRLRGTRDNNYSDGVLQTSRRNAESIVRTSANHVSTHAREQTYEENGDFIKGVRIVATLDMSTTPVCRAEDGKVYPPKVGKRPPFHWACRTTTVPVLKALSEMKISGINDLEPSTRASMDGQVSDALNYNDWLKTQPKDFQDQVLGPARGEIFRRGKLGLDRFVNDHGKTLTLDQLRKIEGLS